MAKKKTDKDDAATAAAPEEKKTDTAARRLRITAPAAGFRRAGRRWVGTCEIEADELTEDQIEALKAESHLQVEEL